MTTTIDTVVIGAGHAGLAVSRLLTEAGRDHVIVDRGRIGESWRTARWDSLRLLSPNWMMRLPHWEYGGPDVAGFLPARRFVRHLELYAESFGAPVVSGATVLELSAAGCGAYRLVTDRGTWRARQVIIATGPGVPRVPAGLREVVTAAAYRNPAQLAPGGVLVIGASASGVQIADELNRAGREVYLSVGRHTRVPRSYRGKDVFWWLERTGRLARTIDEVRDPASARREPSMQLAGRAGELDLVTLQAEGVQLLGRFDGMDGSRARFRPDLAETAASADARMSRLLDALDEYVGDAARERPAALVPPAPRPVVDLHRAGISTVLVATGYRPDYPWLRLPITGPDGQIQQVRGITAAPGVYVVGQRFQHRRDSAFIDGARHDAAYVVQHLLAYRAEPAA
ncbi:putative flavoprotein involved in K+ transport [Kribbella rubisoli]|uniref:Flavoprotein involved in K+ transport n=1 Tax=Kribbella rubisoli TaxID=3075929 RepID=A0A4Q7WYT4_9ACTN|nr:NAD(P)-binding domain-containing protein [Kribbella rubisoli]RZU15737.1 putative flavoprotein involved in K+ transport [Kribbella rubisoli]